MFSRFFYACVFMLLSTAIFAKPITIVCAENFYGSVAKEIGGKYVHTISIIHDPNQDPHLFVSSPTTAKFLRNANIVVYNGIGYDTWMQKLLDVSSDMPKARIVVADLMHKQMGDNPHIWYDPQTMLAYSRALAQALARSDPPHRAAYLQNLAQYRQHYLGLLKQIAALKSQYAGTPVIATEPVFNDMAKALGLTMYGLDFQWPMMNDTEPGPRAVLHFQNKIQQRQVALLIYNQQVSNPLTERMKDLAKKAHVPIVGVTETQPIAQRSYVAWMQAQLNALQMALRQSKVVRIVAKRNA